MKRKTMTTNRIAHSFLQLPALWLSEQHARVLVQKPKLKRPAGSVAPLY
ncbi:MAG: hypothetical protein GY785_07815 [Gammaproteobacteria bacterium]|nr:hypothetical protein [Gammaproteobacteria bacterium]MCP4982122.1 hypothetical protein [Gammaproteobacteria bacterium]